MSAEWRRLASSAGLTVRGKEILVGVPDGRHQTVYLDYEGDLMLRAWSVIARAAVVRQLEEPRLQGWRRNRLAELVGFRVDEKGRMIGETFVSSLGCTADELGAHIKALARACDRFELLLIGVDAD
jgi:hypothetical protein